jgi:hypothetical protein
MRRSQSGTLQGFDGLETGLPQMAQTPAPQPREPELPAMRTEFDFELPRGYMDERGEVHRRGTMRLATARDELMPLMDARVQENAAFTVVLLGRVITRLGTLPGVDASVVERMWASDVAFLQDFYRRINAEGHTRAAVACPECNHRFTIDLSGGRLGES